MEEQQISKRSAGCSPVDLNLTRQQMKNWEPYICQSATILLFIIAILHHIKDCAGGTVNLKGHSSSIGIYFYHINVFLG